MNFQRGGRGKEHLAHPLGETLSGAYDKMRLSGELFRWIVLAAVPIEFYFILFQYPEITDFQRELVFINGAVIATMFFCTRGPLSFLSLGFRAGLDIALDVTNWLRLKPVRNNVRSRISRRYVSLLRYVANQDYDQLVIVAHSQGTVITADLLRFLNEENNRYHFKKLDPSLTSFFDNDDKTIPIKLLTFGSPLKQLYARRFPFQYGWAEPGTDPAGNNQAGPDPDKLNLKRWINLYCSGDYIGRALWYAPDSKQKWKLQWSEQYTSERGCIFREKCIGYGGHIKYWLGEYPSVATTLDDLISHS